MALIDFVERAHEFLRTRVERALIACLIKCELALLQVFVAQLQQHHAGLGKCKAALIDELQTHDGGLNQGAGVCTGSQEWQGDALTVLGT